MKRPRRNHRAEFKARIAREAIRGAKTVAEIAQENGVHPGMVSAWKKAAESKLSLVFDRRGGDPDKLSRQERENDQLARKLGRVVVEMEFLEKKVRSAGDTAMRKAMVERGRLQLSVRRQCELLAVNRNRLESKKEKASEEDLRIMRLIDEIHVNEPTFGSRQKTRALKRHHAVGIGRERIRRLMQLMGVKAIYPKPRTSQPGKGHKIYPYLLRDMNIDRPDQVWSSDITYIPMGRGCCYLAVVIDWHTRCVLGWSVSATMDANLCLDAYRMAVRTAGRTPEVMNTDQGSQYTCGAWIEALGPDVKISMDGKGRWVDNVRMERFWWSIKYEDVYLRAYEDLRELEKGLGRWIRRYNTCRPHSSLDGMTPWDAYGAEMDREAA